MRTHVRTGGQQVNLSMVTAVVCIALGAVSAAMASLNVAIPDLVRSTHASQTQLEWIIDAYLLVFSVLLLPAGALGDRYGRRRALIAGLIVFGAASAAAMAVVLGQRPHLPARPDRPRRRLRDAGHAVDHHRHLPSRRAHEGGRGLGGRRRGERHLGAALQRDPPRTGSPGRPPSPSTSSSPSIALVGTVRFVPESSQPDAPALDKGGALLATVGLVALVFSIIEAPDAGWLSARTLGGIAAGLAALLGFVLLRAPPGSPSAGPAPVLQPQAVRRQPVDLHPVLRLLRVHLRVPAVPRGRPWLQPARRRARRASPVGDDDADGQGHARTGVAIRRPRRVRHRARSGRRRARRSSRGSGRTRPTC